MLKRKMQQKIDQWIENGRKALMIEGARQIGKTYLIRSCLKEKQIDYVELNFIAQPNLVSVFDFAQNAEDLVLRLSLVAGRKLSKGRAVFFFDEVQAYPDIVTKIKFLVEEGSYRYILSGSLLGVELHGLRSAPVGYMDVYDMYPMDLEEFLWANGVSEKIIKTLKTCFEERRPVDPFIHDQMLKLFHLYMIVGGEPEAINAYLRENNLEDVSETQKNILRLYQQDFVKYDEQYSLDIRELFESIPDRLMRKEIPAEENFEKSFRWLKDAGIVLPANNVEKAELPLRLNQKKNDFIMYLGDVGLLTSCFSNTVKMEILQQKPVHTEILQNAVAQELSEKGFRLYFCRNRNLDFLIEKDGKPVAIRVFSGKVPSVEMPPETVDQEYILSTENVSANGKTIYLPLYMILFLEETPLMDPIYTIDIAKLNRVVE